MGNNRAQPYTTNLGVPANSVAGNFGDAKARMQASSRSDFIDWLAGENVAGFVSVAEGATASISKPGSTSQLNLGGAGESGGVAADGNLQITAGQGVTINGDLNGRWQFDVVPGIASFNGRLRPATNNVRDLGQADLRWAKGYYGTSVETPRVNVESGQASLGYGLQLGSNSGFYHAGRSYGHYNNAAVFQWDAAGLATPGVFGYNFNRYAGSVVDASIKSPAAGVVAIHGTGLELGQLQAGSAQVGGNVTTGSLTANGEASIVGGRLQFSNNYGVRFANANNTIFATTGKGIRFYTGESSAAEVMRLDSVNRNVGIGIGDSSPTSRLQVGGDGDFSGDIKLGGNLMLNAFDSFSSPNAGSVTWESPFGGTATYKAGQSGQQMKFILKTSEDKQAGFTHYDAANAKGRLLDVWSQPGVDLSFSPGQIEAMRFDATTGQASFSGNVSADNVSLTPTGVNALDVDIAEGWMNFACFKRGGSQLGKVHGAFQNINLEATNDIRMSAGGRAASATSDLHIDSAGDTTFSGSVRQVTPTGNTVASLSNANSDTFPVGVLNLYYGPTAHCKLTALSSRADLNGTLFTTLSTANTVRLQASSTGVDVTGNVTADQVLPSSRPQVSASSGTLLQDLLTALDLSGIIEKVA